MSGHGPCSLNRVWWRATQVRHQIDDDAHARCSGFQSPQTVLKTAGPASTAVYWRPYRFSHEHRQSMIVRARLQASAGLAVVLAVSEYQGTGTRFPKL